MQAFFVQFHFGPGDSVGTTIEGTHLNDLIAHIHKELRTVGFFVIDHNEGIISINAAGLKYFTAYPTESSDRQASGTY